MNQIFKKKAVAATLVSALAVMGSGFVSVPVVGLMSVAHANEFEGSVVNTVTAKNLLPGSTADTTAVLVINEIGNWSAGNLKLVLPAGVTVAGANLSAATLSAPVKLTGAGTDYTLATTTGFTTAPDEAWAYIDASGQTNIVFGKSGVGAVYGTFTTMAPASVTAGDTILGISLKLKATVAATAGDVNVQIVDGDLNGTNTMGVNAATIKVATVVTSVASAKVATPSNVVAGAGAGAQAPGDITIKLNKTYNDGDLGGKTIDIELGNGATFVAGPGASFTTGGLATSTPATLLSSTKARITITDPVGGAVGTKNDVITIASSAYLGLSGATAGPITATLSSTGSTGIDGFTAQTVTLANATATGVAVAYNDADGNGKLDTLFSGRIPTPNDKVKLTEAALGSLVGGGNIEVTLSNGAKFNTAPTVATSGATLAITSPATVDATKSKATFPVTAASTSVGAATITFPDLDLTSATAGDLSVTIAGTAGATGTVKLLNVVDATNTSTSGTAVSVAGGQVLALPSIVVTETAPGALGSSGVIALEVAGSTLQNASGDASDTAGAVLGTDFTVTIKDANGVAVTGATASYQNGAGAAVDQILIALPAAASSATTGVYTVTVSGLKAKIPTAAAPGDVFAVIASSQGGAGALITGAQDASAWDSTAGMKKATVKVGTVSSASVPTIPAATVTGPVTAQTISATIGAAANDIGKVGSLFVVAIIPNAGIFAKDATGNWKQWDGTSQFPAYSVVNLGSSHQIDIVKGIDLTTIVGTQIMAGYGLGAFGPGGAIQTTASNPTAAMLNSFTYNLVYTVK